MPELPTGTVTFLFTDIEGSTRRIEELGEGGYVEALARHRQVLRAAFGAHAGAEVDTQGDAFLYAFADAAKALAAAAEGQQGLASGPLRVRMGLHTGEPLMTGEGYAGRELHRAARIAAAGHGGQVLVSAATRALVDGELTDLGEHRLKDFPEAVALFQLGSERFPPLKTISNTNLPRPASSFVGRERETEEVATLLRDGARLVTLSGPGGSGKTRLALEAASELVAEFKAGVFWVGLAALRDPTLVAETIGQTLGARDGLAEHIAEREMLLLLDNLEQVVDAAPELASLVEACPNLRLLVTSRELLRVRGEVDYPVPPLEEPEAVSLFCDRAQMEPDETIAGLCQRLDNLPLAVELAAARTAVLSPKQILDRLSQRLDLLKGGRDANARQQTLRATIEWSHDLLDEEEQQLFARLAVFRGGSTLDAAEQVADADLDTLQSLLDKSLLRHTQNRYWMLETIREFASERLDDPKLGRRHADYFLALAEEAWPHLLGTRPHDWLDRLDAEHDNFRAAFDWLEAAGDGESLLQLAGALAEFWGTRGHIAEGRRHLDRALPLGERPSAARARALVGAADLAVTREARPFAAAALMLYRQLGDDWGTALALFTIGNVAVNEADLAVNEELAEEAEQLMREARDLLAQSAELFEQLGDEHLLLLTLYQLSYAHIELGDAERGKAMREEILRRARASGDTQAESFAVGGLVRFAFGEQRFEDALALLAAAIRIDLRFGNVRRIAQSLGRCAHALAHLGRAEEATQVLARSLAVYEETGANITWTARENELTLELIRSKLDGAAFDESWEKGRKLTADEAVALALDSLD